MFYVWRSYDRQAFHYNSLVKASKKTTLQLQKKEKTTLQQAVQGKSAVYWDYENVPVPYDFPAGNVYQHIMKCLEDEGWNVPVEQMTIVVGYKCTHVPQELQDNKNVIVHRAHDFDSKQWFCV